MLSIALELKAILKDLKENARHVTAELPKTHSKKKRGDVETTGTQEELAGASVGKRTLPPLFAQAALTDEPQRYRKRLEYDAT